MPDPLRPSRRNVLAGAAAGALFAGAPRAGSSAAVPSAIAPDLVAAAKKEGIVHFLSSGDLALVQKMANAFEATFPGVKCQAERLGAERIFQRLDMEYGRGIKNVDVVDSSDTSHLLLWKRQGWLAPYVPEDVARHWPESERDPDGMYATFRASMSIIGFNSKQVKPEEAPKGYADLLDPKWSRKLVKAHPGYSGTVTTTTFLVVKHFGWSWYEQLAKQRVLQVQSATEPPKKIAQGERPIMVEGTDYVLFDLQEKGNPVEPVYPVEGCPLIPIPSAVLQDAPHPNAARLLQSFIFTPQMQQMIVDVGNSRAFHPKIKEKPGRRPFKSIKLWRAEPAELLEQVEEIRRKYTEIFGT